MDHNLKRCSLNYKLSLFNHNPRESSILKGTGNRRAKKAFPLFCGMDKEARSIQSK